MSDVVLAMDRVSKKFRKGELHDSLRDLIPAMIGRLTRHRPPEALRDREFWALQRKKAQFPWSRDTRCKMLATPKPSCRCS